MRKQDVMLAVYDLSRITGGVSVVGRLLFRTLYEMHKCGQINLLVQVLRESGPVQEDDLLAKVNSVSIKWCAQSRIKFIWNILKVRPNVIIFDHAGPSKAVRIIPKLIRPLYFVFIHGIEVWENAREDYIKTIRGASLLISNSQYTAKRAKSLHSPLPDIKVCLLGIENSERIINEFASYKLNIEFEKSILIVGRMNSSQRHKGHDELIESLPKILIKIPDAQLLIAGGGDDIFRLKQKAKDYHVENNVHFLGWVSNSELNYLYWSCKAFVMPSRGDGFGLVYLEAMAHKKPCIALKSGAAAEIIENGKTGILIDLDKQNDLINEIIRLLSDNLLAEKMGKAGYQRLNKMFLQEHFDKRLRSILNEWFENKKSENARFINMA